MIEVFGLAGGKAMMRGKPNQACMGLREGCSTIHS
jgi:hypothetical protein